MILESFPTSVIPWYEGAVPVLWHLQDPGAGKEPVLGISSSPWRAPSFSLLFAYFISSIITSTQCRGDTNTPKFLALGSLSAPGNTAFFKGYVIGSQLWPSCLWCSTRQELQHIPWARLSAPLRSFRSGWAHDTNLFTMESDRFYFRGECFHKQRPKIQAQHVTPEQCVHSLSHSNLLMCFMCNSGYS